MLPSACPLASLTACTSADSDPCRHSASSAEFFVLGALIAKSNYLCLLGNAIKVTAKTTEHSLNTESSYLGSLMALCNDLAISIHENACRIRMWSCQTWIKSMSLAFTFLPIHKLAAKQFALTSTICSMLTDVELPYLLSCLQSELLAEGS